jgi:hypothetical protein
VVEVMAERGVEILEREANLDTFERGQRSGHAPTAMDGGSAAIAGRKLRPISCGMHAEFTRAILPSA